MQGTPPVHSLFSAVIAGDVEAVRSHLQQGVDLEARTDRGRTALMLAALHGQTEVVAALLAAGAAPGAMVERRSGPSVFVSEGPGGGGIADLLTDPTLPAEAKGFYEGFAKLLGGLQEAGKARAAEAAATDESEPRFVEPEEEEDENASYEPETALDFALAHGHLPVVERLLAAGAPVMPEVWHAVPPLAIAAERGDVAAARLLLAAGAGPNRGLERTPLAAAAGGGHAEMVRLLLTAGADPNAEGADEETALLRAASSGNLETVRLLVEAGANPRHWAQGETALANAAMEGHEEIVAFLDPLVDDEIREEARRARRRA
jgi:ankyrin repeat protein